MFDQQEVRKHLQESAVNITFNKADGSTRKMKCTLNETLIPAAKKPKTDHHFSDDVVMRVFDLEAGDWRSFVWEKVQKVEF